MKEVPSVLSTFSGVGGLDLGLARAGWQHVGLCERDEYRRAVLAERFPGVPQWDDVRAVQPASDSTQGRIGGSGVHGAADQQLPSLSVGEPRPLGRVDLLCGGFPCQDLSVAGRRAGLAGDRSGLFFEFARIAESVRPEWLLIENVPGLLSSNGGRDFGELLGTLADIGYGVAWRILDSRFFGVPQRRRRVFIVASHLGGRAGAERAGKVLAIGSGCGGHPAAGGEAGQIATGVTGAGSDGPGRGRDEEGSLIVSRMPSTNHGGWRIGAEEAAGGALQVTHTLTSQGFDASEDGTGRGTPLTPNGSSVRRLTPRECERLQGFPETAKTVRMVVWASSAHRRTDAPAGSPSPSELASVWTADASGSCRSATHAAGSSNMRRLGLDLPVAGSALIDFEREAVQIRNPDGLSASASGADTLTPSPLRTPAADIARLAALMMRGLERATPAGAEVSPAFSVPSGLHRSGAWLVHLYGDEIAALASDAALFMSEVSRCTRRITSAASPSSPTSDSTWRTLFSCVAAAISGCIPGGTSSDRSYACEVVGTSGWTAIDWKGKPAPDSRRYAACGDAVTVPVGEWLGRRIAGAL